MISPGYTIGNYRILSKIGTGGMGAVFLAEYPMIGKRAAIKVIHKELASNKDVVSRFFQEARAVNQIGNEHIVEITDFGQTPEGDHFFIMEYLDGRTLASLLAESRVFDVMRSLHVGAQIAEALAAAHACGVIHRDLKPDNVMLMNKLGDRDFVKVLDFGLAKVLQSSSVVKTAAGVLLGTPQYMSPEACESKGAIDHRTDIYALGVLLFQMMTGRLPFEGQTMGEILVKQVTQLPPAPRALNANIAPSVEQILLRCLAKPVDQRFQTMSSLRDALLAPDAYLGSAPPMQPARSVAPGEMGFDAKMLAAHAAAQQAAQQRTTLGTMPAPQPAQRVSAAHSAQTIIAGAPMGMTGSPAMPKMNTMRIATPVGYSSQPPKRTWPIVVALGLILGVGGGVAAVLLLKKKPVKLAPDAAIVVKTIDAAVPAPDAPVVATIDAPAPVAKKIKITFESTPKGAAVMRDGKELGRTPVTLELDATSTDATFELRLKAFKPAKKVVTLKADASISVELEKDPHPSQYRPKDQGPPTGLARPGED